MAAISRPPPYLRIPSKNYLAPPDLAANSAQAAWLISITGLDVNNDIQTASKKPGTD
jgi:hypothetical protein